MVTRGVRGECSGVGRAWWNGSLLPSGTTNDEPRNRSTKRPVLWLQVRQESFPWTTVSPATPPLKEWRAKERSDGRDGRSLLCTLHPLPGPFSPTVGGASLRSLHIDAGQGGSEDGDEVFWVVLSLSITYHISHHKTTTKRQQKEPKDHQKTSR